MKKLTAITCQSIITILFSILALPCFAQQSAKAPDWKPLLSGGTGEVSVACIRAENGMASQILFKHSFPGFTRIALVVRQKANNGSEELHTFTAGGLRNRMYSHSANLIPLDLASNAIESITVGYMAYGVSYRLYINTVDGTRELTMDGKPYYYGPQYSLELQSLPVSNGYQQRILPYPTQPVVTLH